MATDHIERLRYMNNPRQQSNHEENGQVKQTRNFLAAILFVGSIVIVLLLIFLIGIVYLVKENIPRELMYLAAFAIGHFVGAFTSASAFYFGEPRTTVSLKALRKILGEEEGDEEDEDEEE